MRELTPTHRHGAGIKRSRGAASGAKSRGRQPRPVVAGPQQLSSVPKGARSGNARRAGSRREPGTVLDRAVWEREIRSLRVIARSLIVVLLAIGARAILDGVTVAVALTGVVVVALLLACLGLLRQGGQLEPRPEPLLSQAAADRESETRPPAGAV